MNALDSLTSRSSVPAKLLIEPGPNLEQTLLILQAAMSVPDHNNLQPFRFLTIKGDSRKLLAEVFEHAIRQRDPSAGDAYFKKQYQKPLRSPLIIVVVCKLSNNPKVPKIEQQLSAGCAAQNIMQACYALNFGACWLTGANAYDGSVKEALGLDFNEEITGFIYVGSMLEGFDSVERNEARHITEDWNEVKSLETAI